MIVRVNLGVQLTRITIKQENMVARKKWTKEEEEILVQAIAANPHNIMDAVRHASAKLDRTVYACSIHWYKVIAPVDNPAKMGITFIGVGSRTVCKNRKNSCNTFVEPERNSLWMKIKKFIGLK